MDDRSFSNLVLHRIDAACNMARFYAMSIEPTLFGGEALVRNWGRIGTQGRYRMDWFEDKAAAEDGFGAPGPDQMRSRLCSSAEHAVG